MGRKLTTGIDQFLIRHTSLLKLRMHIRIDRANLPPPHHQHISPTHSKKILTSFSKSTTSLCLLLASSSSPRR